MFLMIYFKGNEYILHVIGNLHNQSMALWGRLRHRVYILILFILKIVNIKWSR